MSTHILVVEDERIVALDIRNHLERSGYEVIATCASGEESLEIVRDQNPDLVLMDIQLDGEMDGVEASAIIRRDHHIPVILLTAHADDATIERAKETEPFGYIIKPFIDRELRTAIEMALHRSRLERRLQESEERYRSLFEDDLTGDFIIDERGELLDCNASFLHLFGFGQKADALGSNLLNWFSNPEEGRHLVERLKAGEKIRFLETHLRPHGSSDKTVLANFTARQLGDDWEIKGALIDHTEFRTLEQQLRQSQKMEAIGRLAGSVAHDFNNILTVVMGYATLMREKLRDEDISLPEVEGIHKAARQGATLTRQLLTFSRRQILNPETLDANQLVQDMERMLRRLMTEDITVRHFYAEDPPTIYVDPSQFEQVVMNLAVNARDAMNGGGTLTVETSRTRLDYERSSRTGSIPAGDYAELTVADTGTGIESDVLDKIFDPFFTTKPKERGTGLGLATVYGIVSQSGGFIEVETEPGRGTSFRVLFPLASGPVKERVVETEGVQGGEGDETILLVEDDESVRELLGQILRRRGYRILDASNPGEALLISEQHEGAIDLLISDIVMPHMSGGQLASRLRRESPRLKVLLMSGYPEDTLKDRGEYDREQFFVKKPFEPAEVTSLVRTILDGKA
jgi:two-component system cell cycle sensor histidine kinase/response regulator CckA